MWEVKGIELLEAEHLTHFISDTWQAKNIEFFCAPVPHVQNGNNGSPLSSD